jgi:uncharacterized protein YndB with AHSA1/START domain
MQPRKFTLRRAFTTPAATIFEAFISAEALKEWWTPQGFEVVDAQLDVRVGGRYRLAFRSLTDSHVVFVHGIYHEITPPAKLVFTHVFEERSTYPPFMAVGVVGHETLITVEFLPQGEGAEVLLTQEQLPNAAAEEMVGQGWRAILEQLARYLGAAA